VTLRERDSGKQVRVKVSDLSDVLRKLVFSEIKLESAGKLLK